MKYRQLPIFLLILIISILSGCNSVSKNLNTNTPKNQNISKILNHSITNKYKKITKNGNIQETLDLKLKSDTETTLLNLDISSTTDKNIISSNQTAKYFFIFQNLNKTFQEKNTISGYINLLSDDEQYFIQTQNISFAGPEGKHGNTTIQSQIDEINNQRILLDKEIPFTDFLSTISDLQKSFYRLLLSGEKINLSGNSNLNLEFIGKKIYITYHTSKGILKSELKIKKGFKKTKVYFDGDLVYNFPNTSKEIKLDIKGKYTINKSQYKQVDLPQDYIYFTQTSLVKK